MNNTLSTLIEALTLLSHYDDPAYPTLCEHDILYVFVDPSLVSDDDLDRLSDLGFNARPADGCFYSYRFGNA